MTKNSDAPRLTARKALAMLSLSLLAVVLSTERAHAQWTQPDTNIHNTNGGNVGIGTDATPPVEKLVVMGNVLGGNVTAHTKLYQGYDPQANSIFELGYGTPTSLIAPFASFVLSKNVTSADNVIGTVSFANSGIPDGSDKRLAAIQAWTGGTTTSGNLRFYVMNGGTFAERMRIDSSGNLGLGTASPRSLLHVEGGTSSGQVRVSGTGLAALNLRDNGGPQDAKFYQLRTDGGFFRLNLINDAENAFVRQNILVANSAGNVGLGTASPGSRLVVFNTGGVSIDAGPAFSGVALNRDINSGAVYNTASAAFQMTNRSTYLSFDAWSGAGASTATNILTMTPGGSVGIGTASPSYKLHVSQGSVGIQNSGGDAVLVTTSGAANEILTTGWSAGGFGYLQGGAWGAATKNIVLQGGGGNVGVGVNPSQSYRLDVAGAANVSGNLNVSQSLTVTQSITGGTINAVYQDVAEWVPSEQKLTAGTVVVLDAEKANHVLASTSAYDTKVAGVVSARPGISLGEGGDGKALVATTGRVKVKADATRAPIKVGDLLVTSDAEGVAMKSVPVDLGGTPIHRPGTIIGKALEPLEKGTGEILVLLGLQ
jgi:hypothetical protein